MVLVVNCTTKSEISVGVLGNSWSLCLSGEAMELALRDCCQSIRIGKVLIKRKEGSDEPTVCSFARMVLLNLHSFAFLLRTVLSGAAFVLPRWPVLKAETQLMPNSYLLWVLKLRAFFSRVVAFYSRNGTVTTERDLG